jgi:hypothetical protein
MNSRIVFGVLAGVVTLFIMGCSGSGTVPYDNLSNWECAEDYVRNQEGCPYDTTHWDARQWNIQYIRDNYYSVDSIFDMTKVYGREIVRAMNQECLVTLNHSYHTLSYLECINKDFLTRTQIENWLTTMVMKPDFQHMAGSSIEIPSQFFFQIKSNADNYDNNGYIYSGGEDSTITYGISWARSALTNGYEPYPIIDQYVTVIFYEDISSYVIRYSTATNKVPQMNFFKAAVVLHEFGHAPWDVEELTKVVKPHSIGWHEDNRWDFCHNICCVMYCRNFQNHPNWYCGEPHNDLYEPFWMENESDTRRWYCLKCVNEQIRGK